MLGKRPARAASFSSADASRLATMRFRPYSARRGTYAVHTPARQRPRLAARRGGGGHHRLPAFQTAARAGVRGGRIPREPRYRLDPQHRGDGRRVHLVADRRHLPHVRPGTAVQRGEADHRGPSGARHGRRGDVAHDSGRVRLRHAAWLVAVNQPVPRRHAGHLVVQHHREDVRRAGPAHQGLRPARVRRAGHRGHRRRVPARGAVHGGGQRVGGRRCGGRAYRTHGAVPRGMVRAQRHPRAERPQASAFRAQRRDPAHRVHRAVLGDGGSGRRHRVLFGAGRVPRRIHPGRHRAGKARRRAVQAHQGSVRSRVLRIGGHAGHTRGRDGEPGSHRRHRLGGHHRTLAVLRVGRSVVGGNAENLGDERAQPGADRRVLVHHRRAGIGDGRDSRLPLPRHRHRVGGDDARLASSGEEFRTHLPPPRARLARKPVRTAP